MPDVKAIGEQLVVVVRDYVTRTTAALSARIDELSAQIKAIPAGPAGENGRDGKDGAPGEVGPAGPSGRDGVDGAPGAAGSPGKDAEVDYTRVIEFVEKAIAMLPKPADGKDGAPGAAGADGKDADPEHIKEAVRLAVAELPMPKDGKDGIDGKSVSPEVIAKIVADRVQEAVAALPRAKDGKPGERGQDGRSFSAEEVAPMIAEEVSKAIAAIPRPQDGKDGKDGSDGKSFTTEDVRRIVEAEQAKWALDFERRANDLAQRTVEDMRQRMERAIDGMPKPKDGKDGRDAFELEGLSATKEEDGRTITFEFRRGDQVQKHAITFDVVLDRGVYAPEAAYVKGDGVTFGGSWWIAQKDAPDCKPGEGEGWRLAVKRGRDGKDAPQPTTKSVEPVRLR